VWLIEATLGSAIFLSPMREYIKALNLYVDWENGKIYRKKEKSILDNLLGLFGKSQEGEEYEEVTSPEVERKVKSYKLYELYLLAQKMGKTEFKENLNGQEVTVKIEPNKVTVETPTVVMEYTADKFLLKDKKTGQVQEKTPTLQEFYQMYKEIRKLLAAGSVEQYLHLKAREPQFKQAYMQQAQPMGPMPLGQAPAGGGFSWGSALLGLGGGMLLGYLLGSMLGNAFAEEVQNAPELTPEEQAQIEEQVTAVPEDVAQEAQQAVTEEVAQEEVAPAEDFADMDTPEGGDYFTQLDESVLDEGEGGDFLADADDFGGEDLGGFDDFGGDDFEV